MPEENQRITREHLPGLLLARAIWERGPSLYFPPALKTATDQARACSLEMKTHCVELYRDAPELHEVVLASEALAACAARDARIVELESGQSADMFLTLTGEITQLRAELAAIKAQGVVIDADDLAQFIREIDGNHKMGAGELAEHIAARLNAAPVQQVSVPASAFASRAITHYEAALLAAFPSGSSGKVFNQWSAARRVLAAAPAAPAADAWIPVSERLPAVESRLDQECRVGTLSIAPLNISAAVLVFDGEKVRSTRLEWFDGCLPLPYCITHWMPLPAAPAANSAKGVV